MVQFVYIDQFRVEENEFRREIQSCNIGKTDKLLLDNRQTVALLSAMLTLCNLILKPHSHTTHLS